MVYAHKYEVTFWDESEDKRNIEKGVAFGETCSEVMKNIEDYYGETNIDEISISVFDFGGHYILSENDLETLISKEKENI